MKTSFLIALLPLLAIACAAPESSESSETNASNAAITESADLDGKTAPSYGFARGIFHLRNNPTDTLNLTIEDDNTFVWNINGCDFYGSVCGAWTDNGDHTITLNRGGAEFDWVEGGTYAAKTKGLRVSKHADGSLTIEGVIDGKNVAQEWDPGLDCLRCFGPPACFAPDKRECE